MVDVFRHDPAARAELDVLLREPSLYDEFLRYLARAGYAVPDELLERDWSQPYRMHPGLVDTIAAVYAAPHDHWGVYETCEELVDVEDNFQGWRFRHLQVVQRTIGHKTGTGGSSGVDFLRRALDLTFFPELFEVRTRVGLLALAGRSCSSAARTASATAWSGVPARPATTPARSASERFWLSLALPSTCSTTSSTPTIARSCPATYRSGASVTAHASSRPAPASWRSVSAVTSSSSQSVSSTTRTGPRRWTAL